MHFIFISSVQIPTLLSIDKGVEYLPIYLITSPAQNEAAIEFTVGNVATFSLGIL